MTFIPYVFYRYNVSDGKRALSPKEFWDFLYKKTNVEVAYRKSNPTEIDKDTSWIMPKDYSITYDATKKSVFACYIARHITERNVKKYDKEKAVLYKEPSVTDEHATCRTVFIPSISIVAFADQAGEGLIKAASGASRFATIVRHSHDMHCEISLAATHADLKDALKDWELLDFSFTARPFNPTIRNPGDLLHTLLTGDNAKIIGKATPNKKESLNVSEDGFIHEVTGLAQHGYAEYGAKGTTPSGFVAKIIKPQAGKGGDTQRRIIIYIPLEESEEAHILNVAKTALETYRHP